MHPLNRKEAATIPIISRTLTDGTLLETLYCPLKSSTSLAMMTPDGRVSISESVEHAGERLVPYSPRNNLLATGCVLLPAAVGDFEDVGDLVREIRSFLHRYVDLTPLFEEIAAHYILLTWVYDAFSELGYLRLRGDYGTGKTRALRTIGALCYKPFFASGASTVSPIFHVLDAVGGTLVLDEADFRFSDATVDLTKILNNGTVKGLPVLRTMADRHRELNPRAFSVFGPKVIGMRHEFADAALESRFLTEETGRRPLRPDIPIHTPASLMTEAAALRDKLLAWRFHARWRVGPDPSRLVAGVEPRRNQTILALLSLVEDAALRERIGAALVDEEARVLEERASTLEATMLALLVEAFRTLPTPHVLVAECTKRFNAGRERTEGQVSNKWVGWVLRKRLRLTTVRVRGVYAVPRTELEKILALAVRHGVMQENRDHA